MRAPREPAERPTVSVLMGLFNCGPFVTAALDSLSTQSYVDWELVACDDGSTDDTWEVATAYAHQHPGRVTLLRNETNRGLAHSLNRCLEVARGHYLARQDADDQSLPDRFATQVRFLESHREFGWVSTAMVVTNGERDVGLRALKPTPELMDLVRSSAFAHAPTMFRAEVLREVGGYKVAPYTRRTEDYDLWMRLFASGHRGHNLSTPLYRVREDGGTYGRKRFRYRIDEARTRFHGYRAMKAPLSAYLYVLRPVLVGAIPLAALKRLHEWRARSGQETVD